MSYSLFILAVLLAGTCVGNVQQQHPKLTSPYCGMNVTYKKVHPRYVLRILGCVADSLQSCICETTPGVNSFSGYVHLPSSLLTETQDPSDLYNISTFFWYFEVSNDDLVISCTFLILE